MSMITKSTVRVNHYTFSPIASCMRTVSPDILPTTSPVFVSLSKKEISCRRIVLRYKFLILAACRSPVTIQQATSAIVKEQLCAFFTSYQLGNNTVPSRINMLTKKSSNGYSYSQVDEFQTHLHH